MRANEARAHAEPRTTRRARRAAERNQGVARANEPAAEREARAAEPNRLSAHDNQLFADRNGPCADFTLSGPAQRAREKAGAIEELNLGPHYRFPSIRAFTSADQL